MPPPPPQPPLPLPSTTPAPCPFCAISAAYPPSGIIPPSTTTPTPTPTTTTTPLPSPYPTTATAPAHLILSTPHCLAFLDHAPLARGHTLLCVRTHRPKACDLTTSEAASLGRWLGVLGRAVTRAAAADPPTANANANAKQEQEQELSSSTATKKESRGEQEQEQQQEEESAGGDWNVVQNNGVRAAQVVPHVHYHIIPRVGGEEDAGAAVRGRSWTVFGRGQREGLDEVDAGVLVGRIRGAVSREVEGVRRREGEGSVELLFGRGGDGDGDGWERRWGRL